MSGRPAFFSRGKDVMSGTKSLGGGVSVGPIGRTNCRSKASASGQTWRARITAGRRVTRIVALALLMVALASWSTSHASGPEAEVSLQPRNVTVDLDDGPFEVVLAVAGIDHVFVDRDVRSEGLGVFEFAIQFDPNVIEVTDAEPGSFFGSTGRSISCFSQVRPEEPGVFVFACVSNSPPAEGPQGAGTLAHLTIRPVGGGSSDLHIEGEFGGPLGSTGDDIPFKFGGGSVTVIGPPRPTSTPGGPAPTSTPNPGDNSGDGTPPGDGSPIGTPQFSDPTVGDLPTVGIASERQAPTIALAVAYALTVLGAIILLGGTWKLTSSWLKRP